MLTRRTLLRAGAALALPTGLQHSHALSSPNGPVVLTISGQIRSPNAGGQALFDMAMLERLPQASFTTSTPWFAQPRRFTGPLLRDVLRDTGAHGSMLHIRALNDYEVDIPFDDAQRHDVLLARLLDGKPMPVRSRGPLFVIYPFDAEPELRNPVYYSRSAWQLSAIEVR